MGPLSVRRKYPLSTSMWCGAITFLFVANAALYRYAIATSPIIQPVGPDVYLWLFWSILFGPLEAANPIFIALLVSGLTLTFVHYRTEMKELTAYHANELRNGRCILSSQRQHFYDSVKVHLRHCLFAATCVPLSVLCTSVIVVPIVHLFVRSEFL